MGAASITRTSGSTARGVWLDGQLSKSAGLHERETLCMFLTWADSIPMQGLKTHVDVVGVDVVRIRISQERVQFHSVPIIWKIMSKLNIWVNYELINCLIHLFVSTNTFTFTFTHICCRLEMLIFLCISLLHNIYINIYRYKYIYTYINTYICIYIYIHRYKYRYT